MIMCAQKWAVALNTKVLIDYIIFGEGVLKWSKKKTQNHYCTACRIPSACHHWLVLTTDKTATTNKRYQRYTQ